MNDFISKYREQLSGVLSGFDRLVFRGNLALNNEAGLKGYLWANGLKLKDFGEHAQQLSRRVKQASVAVIQAANRPVKYLNSGKVPGATTVADVNKFYESKVPMKRGCYGEDVLKAILYIVDQQYETGQAIPVTGGQVMLH